MEKQAKERMEDEEIEATVSTSLGGEEETETQQQQQAMITPTQTLQDDDEEDAQQQQQEEEDDAEEEDEEEEDDDEDVKMEDDEEEEDEEEDDGEEAEDEDEEPSSTTTATRRKSTSAVTPATTPTPQQQQTPTTAAAVVVVQQLKEPPQIGDRLRCLWLTDHKYQPCDVLLIRKVTLADGTEQQQYYVHYHEWNKRLDEWVTLDRLASLQKPDSDKKKGSSVSHKAHRAEDPNRPLKSKGGGGSSVGSKAGGGGSGGGDPQKTKQEAKRHLEMVRSVKNINSIELGCYEIEAWYFSPYPECFSGSKLFICEFCLKYMKSRVTLERHLAKCPLRHPPGLEIYRDNALSMWELDGRKSKVFCQNLCLIGKLFLDHKTLDWDVEPFWFYVMTECDQRGYHLVGYFSKEKESEKGYNLACICTLPPHQKKGYGKFLISFSYELSKIERKVGSPEKPLSDLGLLSYRSYWSTVLIELLKNAKVPMSIKMISEKTSITVEEIKSTLVCLGVLRYDKGEFVICLTPKVIEDHMKNSMKIITKVNPARILWTPPKM